MNQLKQCALLTLFLLLAACAPGATPVADAPTAQPAATDTAVPVATQPPADVATLPASTMTTAPAATTPATAETAEPTAEATVAPSPTAATEVNGRTAEGAFFLGSGDAPVTIIDYSDFL